MKNYALTFTGAPSTVGSTFAIKDNAGTDGTDALTKIQDLRFADQTMSTADFHLASGLKQDSFYQLLDLYIVQENRAPVRFRADSGLEQSGVGTSRDARRRQDG